jgi:hypothetical protein
MMKKIILIVSLLVLFIGVQSQTRVIRGDLVVEGNIVSTEYGSLMSSTNLVYLSLTGSDSNEGTEESPWRTFDKVIKEYRDSALSGAFPLTVHLGPGKWQASEIFPKINRINTLGARIILAGEMDTVQVINVTHPGTGIQSYFRWRTDSTIIGDVSNHLLGTSKNGTTQAWIGYPIVSNSASAFISPMISTGVGLNRVILNWVTEIEVQTEDVLRGDRIRFQNIKFVQAEAIVNYDFIFTNDVDLNTCYMSNDYPTYGAVSVWGTRTLTINGCILEHYAKSTTGDCIELTGPDNTIINSYIHGVGGPLNDGLEFRPMSSGEIYHNVFDTHKYSIKNDGNAAISMGSTLARNATTFLHLHDPRYHLVTEAEDTWTAGYDSLICENVTNFMNISDVYDAGIYIALPQMKAGGYTNFAGDTDFRNNTLNLDKNYHISVNGGVKYYKQPQLTGSLTDSAPTDAEIDAITGTTPAVVGAGWTVTILDSDGTGLLYRIESDGTYWDYQLLTRAL